MLYQSPESRPALKELPWSLGKTQEIVSHDEAAAEGSEEVAEDAHSIVYTAWLLPPDRDKRRPRCLMYDASFDVEDGDEHTSLIKFL